MGRKLVEVRCHGFHTGGEACLAEARSLSVAFRQSALVGVACKSILGEHRAATAEAMVQ